MYFGAAAFIPHLLVLSLCLSLSFHLPMMFLSMLFKKEKFASSTAFIVRRGTPTPPHQRCHLVVCLFLFSFTSFTLTLFYKMTENSFFVFPAHDALADFLRREKRIVVVGSQPSSSS